MSDNDMIRRGDALAIVARDRVPTNRTGSEFRVVSTQDMLKVIAALPAVTPAPDAAAIREAALREAAGVADKMSIKWWSEYKDRMSDHCADPHYQGMSDGADEVGQAILALIGKEGV